MSTELDDVDALMRGLKADCASAMEIVLARAGPRVRAEVRALLNPARDVDLRTRISAIAAAGRLRIEEAVDDIDRHVDRFDNLGRLVSADALGRIGVPRAVEVLQRLINDRSPEVRRFVALAFGRIGNEEARRSLAAMNTVDPNPLVRDTASGILNRLQ